MRVAAATRRHRRSWTLGGLHSTAHNTAIGLIDAPTPHERSRSSLDRESQTRSPHLQCWRWPGSNGSPPMWQNASPVTDQRSPGSSEYRAATWTSPSVASRAFFHPRGAPVGMTSGLPSGHGGGRRPGLDSEALVTAIRRRWIRRHRCLSGRTSSLCHLHHTRVVRCHQSEPSRPAPDTLTLSQPEGRSVAEVDGNRTRQGTFAPSPVLKTGGPTRRPDTSRMQPTGLRDLLCTPSVDPLLENHRRPADCGGALRRIHSAGSGRHIGRREPWVWS